MRNKYFRTKNAFTLVETLLYIALVSIILLSLTTFMSAIISTQSKNEAIFEVDQQATLAMQRITEAIRNADNINSPGIGASSSTLSLASTTVGENPTIFNLNSNKIYVTLGVNSPVELTTENVIITNLTFKNMTPVGSPDAQSIKISFTASYNSSSGGAENNYTQVFHGAATVRE